MLKTLSLSLILLIGRGIYTQAEASAPVTAKNSSSVVAEKSAPVAAETSAPVAAENFPVKATGDFSFKAEKGDFSENTTSPCTPAPLSYRESKGTFRWKPSTPIRYQADTDTTILRTALADFRPMAQWVRLKPSSSPTEGQKEGAISKGSITLQKVGELVWPHKERLSQKEAYYLIIKPKGVIVQATTDAGLFYGLQTLMQLTDPTTGEVRAAVVEDAPRFGYRGVMLDVSRHFRSKEFLMKQIRLMATYKMNHLHLHLTDAAGWRLQIDRYPRLTQLAAWRTHEVWKPWWNGDRHYCEEGSPNAHGGYYTKAEIRELVEYARRHCITIIPEIEMPAHSEEVLTAYPELSCTHEPYKQPDFCVGNEQTFTFLQGVLDEVIELFPSHYIHIGGDEAGKASWKSCPLCRQRMEQEGLKNVNELQSYLIARIGRYLKSKGRALLGWDEILEGGLAPEATVMSWRGEEGGRKAMETGHQAIMTPGAFCYLDSYQDAPPTQPEAIGGYLPLEKVYSYDPQPYGELLLGVQGNLWTEYIPTEEHLEYMLYPRAIALAEVGWSQRHRMSWTDFRHRMISRELPRMRAKGYQPFDLEREAGNRTEALQPIDHLAKGKRVTFIAPYWEKYPANGVETLTDGVRGGWGYGDGRWMAFLGKERMDVVIDLEEEQEIHAVWGDFMQICGPGVFLPAKVTISASTDGKHYTLLKEIEQQVVKDDAVNFRRYGWEGQAKARYIRFRSNPDAQYGGIHFIDEVVVK